MRLTTAGSLFQEAPVIGITLNNASAVSTDARPWITTAVDSFTTVDLDLTGAGTSA